MVRTADLHHVYYVHVVKALNEPYLSVLGMNLRITIPVLQMRKSRLRRVTSQLKVLKEGSEPGPKLRNTGPRAWLCMIAIPESLPGPLSSLPSSSR